MAEAFLLSGVAGIVTNLAAGWRAARLGLAAALSAGLLFQIGALSALSHLDPASSVAASVGLHFMANAAGRLIDALLSGPRDQFGGCPCALPWRA